MNLIDCITIRLSELSRILAGFGLIAPRDTWEKMQRLRPDELLDERAQEFLVALKPDSNPVTLAFELGLETESVRWMGLAVDNLFELHPETAKDAVTSIKKLCIARSALRDLSPWLSEAMQIGAYHGRRD